MSRENVEVARRWWAAFNEDGAVPLDLCHDSIEITNPSQFPGTGPYLGHAGVREWEADTWEVFLDLQMDVDEIIDVGDGERVVSVQTVRGRFRHSSLPTNVEWAGVWTVRGGKVARAQGYLSRAEALEAVGLRE